MRKKLIKQKTCGLDKFPKIFNEKISERPNTFN